MMMMRRMPKVIELKTKKRRSVVAGPEKEREWRSEREAGTPRRIAPVDQARSL